jgi:hypothetical protein
MLTTASSFSSGTPRTYEYNKFKGIVSRKFAILLLVSLESYKYSTPLLLKPFLNLSPFSWRIFYGKISTPTCTPLKNQRYFFNLTLDFLLILQEKYYQCINFGARCKLAH